MKYILILFFIPIFTFVSLSQQLPKVLLVTELGEIMIEVDTVQAPVTAKNFIGHVSKGTYKKAVFYRSVRMDNQPQNKVKIEVIQGGLYSDGEIEKISPIKHETTEMTGLQHLDGTVSMARVEPGTASTEFFICIGNQPELDFGGKRNPDGKGFAAFGRVISGMDVVRKIQKQKDNDQYLIKPVRILKVKCL